MKLAIARLQTEFKKLKEKAGDTFVTQAAEDGDFDNKKEIEIDDIFEILTR